MATWRARASKEYPSDLRAAKPPVRHTLLSTLCQVQQREITGPLQGAGPHRAALVVLRALAQDAEPLLKALELKSNNTVYRPVMDAIALLKRYLDQPIKEGAYFDEAEKIPLDKVVPDQWR